MNLRKMVAFLLSALLPACGPIPPPIPIPTPTPPPPTTTTTTTTLPPAPTQGLKVVGNRIVQLDGTDPRILGTIIGCHIDGMLGWPGICLPSLDAIKEAGLNWTHVRTGPFTAEGESPEFAFYLKDPATGKYDLTRINEVYLQNVVRAQALEAQARGIVMEVDGPDRWVRQHGREGSGSFVIHPMRSREKRSLVVVQASKLDPWRMENNVQGEEHGGLEIFQGVPDAVHEAYIRAYVRVTCDIPTVMYPSGNEAFKSDSEAWERRFIEIVRDQCRLPHIIGINSDVGRTLGDYFIEHQSVAPAPLAKPALVNEYGPDISPEEVVNQAQIADAQGTYFEYWRGSHSSEEWKAVMADLGKIRAGQPIPPVGCLPPPGDEGWVAICKARADIVGDAPVCSSLGISDQKAAALRAAQSKAVADNPALFQGDCLRELNQANVVKGLNAIGKAARELGECAGKKDDAVFFRRADGDWQEEHGIAQRSGCFPAPNRAWLYVWRHPSTPTPPPPATCSLTNEQITEWRWQLKAEAGQLVDLTVYVCGPAARAELRQCGTSCCPLGDVEGNGACREKLLGDPVFETVGPVTIVPQGAPPIFTNKVDTGDGHLKARGSKGPNSFRRWHIFAGIPACDAATMTPAERKRLGISPNSFICASEPLP